MLTPEELIGWADRVSRAIIAFEEGDRSLPWEVQDSCSFRRIGSKGGRFRDGNILHATNHHLDGHPDLSMSTRHLQGLVDLANMAPEIAAVLRALSIELAKGGEA